MPTEVDLVLLKLSDSAPDHPCAFVGGDPRLDELLYSFGYPDDFHGDSVTFRYEGPSRTSSGHKLLKLKGGQARPGLSGAALLNLRTGRVCGVVNKSRDITSDIGGRAVPAECVFSTFVQLSELQQGFHGDHPQWKRTFFALDPNFREGSITLPEAIDWIASHCGTSTDNKQRCTLDFKRHLQGEIALCSLTPEEGLAEIEHWVLEVEKSSNDYADLARARLFRNSFGEAAQLSRQAAENKRARLEGLQREQQEISKEIKNLTVEVSGDFRRSGDALRLKYLFADAIRAYEDSLEYVDRSQNPKNWADILGAISNTHLQLGTRLEGAAAHESFSNAANTARKILDAFTPEQQPLLWADGQHHLANALKFSSERTEGEKGRQLILESLSAYRSALGVVTAEKEPDRWAWLQSNLAGALDEMAARSDSGNRAELLTQAVSAYRKASEIRTREKDPVEWAETQNNLAGTLIHLEGPDKAVYLKEALSIYRGIAQVRLREELPQDWAQNETNLALVLTCLGDSTDWTLDGERFAQEAVEHCRAALEVRSRNQHPQGWAHTQRVLGETLLYLASKSSTLGQQRALCIQEGVAAFNSALEVFTRKDLPFDWASTHSNLGDSFFDLAAQPLSSDRRAYFKRAISEYRRALKVFTQGDFPVYCGNVRHNLSVARQHSSRFLALMRSIKFFWSNIWIGY